VADLSGWRKRRNSAFAPKSQRTARVSRILAFPEEVADAIVIRSFVLVGSGFAAGLQ